MADNAEEQDLVPVFMPLLSALLLHAEDLKGQPLTSAEVTRVRDEATCIMMTRDDALKLAESRGRDLDPENCWYDFQMLRRELGRKPDLDPGPMFRQLDGHDSAYQRTVAQAQQTLEHFRALLPADERALLKTKIVQGDESAYMWLSGVRIAGDGFKAMFFEVPEGFTDYEPGDEMEVAAADVLDWMINDDGVLQGGFSLRYQRERMPEDERAAYDDYIGVTKYA